MFLQVCANKPQHCSAFSERLEALSGRVKAALGEIKSHLAGQGEMEMGWSLSKLSPVSISFQVGGIQANLCFLHGDQVSPVLMA